MNKKLLIGLVALAFTLTTGLTVWACCGCGCPDDFVSVSCTPDTLWPPNHKYVDITVSAETNTSPIYGWKCKWKIVGVASDQPDDVVTADPDDDPDGETTDDIGPYDTGAQVSGASVVVPVRSERRGDVPEGRTYTIVLRTTCPYDYYPSCCNAYTACEVVVPHDQDED